MHIFVSQNLPVGLPFISTVILEAWFKMGAGPEGWGKRTSFIFPAMFVGPAHKHLSPRKPNFPHTGRLCPIAPVSWHHLTYMLGTMIMMTIIKLADIF